VNILDTHTIGSPALWLGLVAFVVAMLAIDLGVFHRRAHEVTLREAAAWSIVWVALSGLFAGAVHRWFGPELAVQFVTAYVVEKALSVDNVFVFVVIFAAFSVPPRLQHRVLFWGVLGALAMRAAFIFAGSALLQRFHATMYVFGGILLLTGIKLLLQKEEDVHPESNPLVRLFQRVVPMTHRYEGASFVVRDGGRRVATPLLLTLVAVEATDLIFAVDSIPAVFAITRDPFIVFTSNIFAILGLRSMYFLLAGVVTKFRYLKVGLSFVLVFVGAKMVLVDVVKLPVEASLLAIASILGVSVVASLVRPAASGVRSESTS
jgi:tellurite resistance protein TerC